MIICIPVPISFLTQKGHRNIKNDIGMDGDTYDHSLQLHYRLLDSFLLIYHPYDILVIHSSLSISTVTPQVTFVHVFTTVLTSM